MQPWDHVRYKRKDPEVMERNLGILLDTLMLDGRDSASKPGRCQRTLWGPNGKQEQRGGFKEFQTHTHTCAGHQAGRQAGRAGRLGQVRVRNVLTQRRKTAETEK